MFVFANRLQIHRRGVAALLGEVALFVEHVEQFFFEVAERLLARRHFAIGDVIERHMITIGALPNSPHEARTTVLAERQVANLPDHSGGSATRLRQCPKCGEAALIRAEGCDQCTSCDYSKCG